MSINYEFEIHIFGPLFIENKDGKRLFVPSKRGRALLAALACAKNFERGRSWLQSTLWCNREDHQAQASLRRELFKLRSLLNSNNCTVLHANKHMVWLDPQLIRIAPKIDDAVFVEGLDLNGEEHWEDWLREQRAEFSSKPVGTQDPSAHNAAHFTASNPAAPRDHETQLAIAFAPCRGEQSDHMEKLHSIASQLAAGVARRKWLPVKAVQSNFAAGAFLTLDEIGKSTGAAYIAMLSLDYNKTLQDGDLLNISLVHAPTARTLKATSYCASSLLGDKQGKGEMAYAVAEICRVIEHCHQSDAINKDDNSLTLEDMAFRARWHLAVMRDDGIARAASYIEAVRERSPHWHELLVDTAWLKTRSLWFKRDDVAGLLSARSAAQLAILSDPQDARGYVLAGTLEIWLGQITRAKQLLRRAIELDPSFPLAHAQLGIALHMEGQILDAIARLEKASLLAGKDNDSFYYDAELSFCYLLCGNYELALQCSERSLALRSPYWLSHAVKFAALDALSRKKDAELARLEFHAAVPVFSPTSINLATIANEENGAKLAGILNLLA